MIAERAVSPIEQSVSRLDSWLETMRQSGGYGGPVPHWWRSCLQFAGAGLDWRYEGIIGGYLELYLRTSEPQWLDRARRAGDDLVGGQLPNGSFRNSCFELNPDTGGTPHEAACDTALLNLAAVLRESGHSGWQAYLATAKRNLQEHYIHRLWDADRQGFRDHPQIDSFVPNKAATLLEALFSLCHLTEDDVSLEIYGRPTLAALLRHQVRGGPLDGAIYQNSLRGRLVEKFFPYYIARCVPALVQAYEWWRDERYLDGARRAMGFVLRWRYEDGSFPQVIYPRGRINRFPQWIAGTADVLRAMDLLGRYGADMDPEPTETWLLGGQLPSGGFRTAHGFAAQVSQRPPDGPPEFRDLLPACGWNDKAFRYLAGLVTVRSVPGVGVLPSTNVECSFLGRRFRYHEDAERIELRQAATAVYGWHKAEAWAIVRDQRLVLA